MEKRKGRKPFEEERPEIFEPLKLALANPFEDRLMIEVAREYDISTNQLRGFYERHMPAIKKLQDRILAHDFDDVIDELKALARRATHQASDTLHKASPKDAALIASIAIEKIAFLQKGGKHEISVIHEHRDELGAVGALIVKELERRGLEMPTPLQIEGT